MGKNHRISVLGTLFFYTDAASDEVVVFSPDSGDTHLIDPLSAHLLELISKQPKTWTDLVEYGKDLLNEVNINVVEEFIDDWQLRFKNMELIEVGEKS